MCPDTLKITEEKIKLILMKIKHCDCNPQKSRGLAGMGGNSKSNKSYKSHSKSRVQVGLFSSSTEMYLREIAPKYLGKKILRGTERGVWPFGNNFSHRQCHQTIRYHGLKHQWLAHLMLA